jgi:hypothetical protein
MSQSISQSSSYQPTNEGMSDKQINQNQPESSKSKPTKIIKLNATNKA